jgi:hypothetical protein
MCRTTSDVLGSPPRLARSCFHLRCFRLVSFDRSLEIFHDLELILSRVRLFRAPSFRLLASHLSARASPALGFLALFATSPVRSHSFAPSPTRRFVPSSGFLDLSTSFSALGLAGLFHPAATSRFLPVQGLLSPRSRPSSSEGSAPLPSLPVSLTDFRRLPLDQNLDFEALLHARPRSLQNRYSQRCTPLPSSGSAPPGPLDFFRLDSAYPCPPLSTFLRSAFARRDRGPTSSSASLPAKPGVASPLRPTCSRFRAFPPTLRARHSNSPPVALRRAGSGTSFTARPVALTIDFASRSLRSSVARPAERVSTTIHRDRFAHADSSSRPSRSTVARGTSLSPRVCRSVARSTPSAHDALAAWLRHAASLFRNALLAWLPTR